MANSIDININFRGDNTPNRPENENQVESKPSKAQEKLDTEALKSKTESTSTPKTTSKPKAEPEQSALEKYISGKAVDSRELLKELKGSDVKVSKKLETLMTKGTVWVSKKRGVYGKPYDLIEEDRNHGNRNKNKLQADLAKSLEAALKKRENELAQLATSIEAVQAPVTETSVQEDYFDPKAIEEASKEASEYKSRSTVIRMSPDQFLQMAERLGSEGAASVSPEKTKTVTGVLEKGGKFSSLPYLSFEIDQKTGKAKVTGHEGRHRAMALKNLGATSMPVVFRGPIRWDQQSDQGSFDRVKKWPSSLFGETEGEIPFPVSDPLKTVDTQTQDILNKIATTPMFRGVRGDSTSEPKGPQYFSSSELFAKTYGKTSQHSVQVSNPLVVSNEDWGNYANNQFNPIDEIVKRVKKEGYDSVVNVRKTPSGNELITVFVVDASKTVDTQTSAVESVANALEKPEPIAQKVEQAVQPVVEAKDSLFNYTQESPGKPAEPVVATKTKDVEKKLKDAIVTNVEQAAQSAAESINKAMSGGGGKKPPNTTKAPPTGDDGEDDDAFNQFMQGFISEQEFYRVLVAQVENLERSFESKLFTAKESTLPSSLQRTFEAGRRTKDFEDTQKLVDEKVASATSSAKSFRTNLENPSNTLEARIKDYIDKVSESENIDQEKLALLHQVLKRVQTVREKTQQSYDEITQAISTEIPESAVRGFAQGKIDRDIEELEMQQKDEDRTVKQFQREFKSFVTKKYKELANVEAFEAAKTYVETNRGKLNKRDLDAMAKIAYDKKFEEFMASVSYESELSTEEIMAAYQEGQGTFKPEAFRPKNAPKNFYGKPEKESQPLNIDFDPFAGKGGKGGGGGGTNPPTGFGPDGEEIPPSRANIGLLSQGGGIDIQAIKNFKIAEASINAIGRTLVSASTKEGVRPGQIFGQTANAATTIGLTGYAASGAATIASGAGLTAGGLTAAGAAGATAGPIGLMVAGITLSASYLSEIADNTSKNVQAFSPDLILADIDNKMKNLVNNMEIANSRGSSLANYQQSSNQLSRQLYNLGVDVFDQVGPFIQIMIDAGTIVIVLLRALTVTGTIIFRLLNTWLEPLTKGVKTVADSVTSMLDWLLGRRTKLPDFEQEFMQNDPRK